MEPTEPLTEDRRDPSGDPAPGGRRQGALAAAGALVVAAFLVAITLPTALRRAGAGRRAGPAHRLPDPASPVELHPPVVGGARRGPAHPAPRRRHQPRTAPSPPSGSPATGRTRRSPSTGPTARRTSPTRGSCWCRSSPRPEASSCIARTTTRWACCGPRAPWTRSPSPTCRVDPRARRRGRRPRGAGRGSSGRTTRPSTPCPREHGAGARGGYVTPDGTLVVSRVPGLLAGNGDTVVEARTGSGAGRRPGHVRRGRHLAGGPRPGDHLRSRRLGRGGRRRHRAARGRDGAVTAIPRDGRPAVLADAPQLAQLQAVGDRVWGVGRYGGRGPLSWTDDAGATWHTMALPGLH